MISPSSGNLVYRGLKRPPLGQLGPLPWRDWSETKAVVAALTADGQEVRFIGGCVRDGILKIPPQDIDFATPDTPEQVMALLERAGIRAIPTGLAHGTVTAVIQPRQFEITTLRRDVATDGRHAEVEWTEDWQADAARRDFTINALSARPDDGAIYDYFNGIDHLAQGRVVFIGRAQDRVTEDYLRILRFFRFFSRFGKPPADADALAACTSLASKLATLSAERIRDEILKIIVANDAAEIMLLMRGARVFEHILPELQNFGRLRQLAFLESRGLSRADVAVDPLRRLAALLPDDGDIASQVAARLRLSNADTDRLAAMITALARLPAVTATLTERRAALHRLGGDITRDALLLTWADERATNSRIDPTFTHCHTDFLHEITEWDSPAFPLKGRDLEALGVVPGREMGSLLASLEAWWTDRGCTDGAEVVLAEARRRLG